MRNEAGGVQSVRHRQQQVRQVNLRTRKERTQTTSDPKTGELICSTHIHIYHTVGAVYVCFYCIV